MIKPKKVKKIHKSQDLIKILNQLHHEATIESIGSSTRLAGVKLSNEEVEKLLFGKNDQNVRTHDTQ